MAVLEVLVAHSGQKLSKDSSGFSSLDEFKKWVSLSTSIPLSNVVVLTSQGRSAKAQSLHLESRLFVYDTRISSSKGQNVLSLYQAPTPADLDVYEPPNSIADIKSISAWKDLYRKRQEWVTKITTGCSDLQDLCADRFNEIDVILQCMEVALTNLDLSVRPLQSRYDEFRKWAPGALKDNEMLARSWESYLELARSIPTSPEMVSFMTGKQIPPGASTSLEDLLEPETSRRAGRLAMTSLKKLQSQVDTLDKDALNMQQSFGGLNASFDQIRARPILARSEEPKGIFDGIQTIAKKIDTDYQMTLQYSDVTKDLSQASRIAHTHTDKLLPTLGKRAAEMADIALYVTQYRNQISEESMAFMRTITETVSLIQRLKLSLNRMNEIDEEMSTFDYLRLIHQLPYMYSSFIAEAVRRREWKDKMTTDSTSLANTMALFQDEETKRRRKWAKMVGSTYLVDRIDAPAMRMEVNLLGDQEDWPALSKKDLEDFIAILSDHNSDPEVLEDIQKLLSDLNAPTRQQVKRIKAFKNGSLHETSMGYSGLMIRGDDDLVRALQEDKAKLESKVTTADSRIKRLEDLLHRQNQARSTPFSSLDFSLKSSPRPNSRRRSTVEFSDPAVAAQLEQLKNDLAAEKEKMTAADRAVDELQAKNKELAGNNEELQGKNEELQGLNKELEAKIDEYMSTKKDLMCNFEALERDFNSERKSLKSEMEQLREKLEEAEDYIENSGMSRENEKATYDERVLTLKNELEKAAKELHDNKLRYDGQVEYQRTEARLQRETMETMQKQIQALQEENKALAKKLSAAQATTETQNRALQDIHHEVAAGAPLPDDLCDVPEAVVSKTLELVGKLKTVESDVSVLRSELDQSQASNKELRAAIADSSKKLGEMEATTSQLRESVAEERARAKAMEAELEHGRTQISELRIKISDGETGSESLRKKLEDDEKRLGSLKEELARRQSQVGRLEEELVSVKDKLSVAQAKYSGLESLFQVRTEKAKDLTKRIYVQNDRLVRLLERLGFIVTREGPSMTVQRIPRAERSTAQLLPSAENSESPSMARQASSASALTSKSGLEGEDLEQIYWMNNADAEAESEKYLAFINSLGGFDVETFTETVYRRLKDIEHVARKLQRDSRTYRDKAHSMQKESHEKIAFKNFKEGDLALFLPTRNQSAGAWAAFNIGFPHYFLREQDSHRLRTREWLVARITRVQERVVDLSKSLQQTQQHTAADTDSVDTSEENDNPFQLSDGLRWYLIDAHEDKPGAPSTPGLGKSTVASNKVSAVADMHAHAGVSMVSATATAGGSGGGSSSASIAAAVAAKDKRRSGIEGVSKTLSRSLESRRSSNSSRKALPFAGSGAAGGVGLLKGNALASETNSLKAATPPGVSSPLAATAQSAADTEAEGAVSRPRAEIRGVLDSFLGS